MALEAIDSNDRGMPLCNTCTQFFQVTTFEYRERHGFVIDNYTGTFPHHISLRSFLEAVDEKCFVCWRIFYNSFDCPAEVRELLQRIAHATPDLDSLAEWSQLPILQRCVTSIQGDVHGIRPDFNGSFLYELKELHNLDNSESDELFSDIYCIEGHIKTPLQRAHVLRSSKAIWSAIPL